MRWVGALVALCGCNQVFGIEPSILVDAQQFDSPLDAPYQCPPSGTTPRFSRLLHQVSTDPCGEYSYSSATNRALAYCRNDDDKFSIWEGTVDNDDLQPAIGFEPGGLREFQQPRLTPEGDEVYVRVTENGSNQLSVYRRDPAGWILQSDLTIPLSVSGNLYSVTRGPSPRVFATTTDNATIREFLSDDAGGWTEVGAYTGADLGMTSVSQARVTEDGLRMVFTGIRPGDPRFSVFYAERSDLSRRFGVVSLVEDIPPVFGLVLANDCSRLYFSGLDAVFYVRQP